MCIKGRNWIVCRDKLVVKIFHANNRKNGLTRLDSKAFRNDSNSTRIEKLLDSPISVLVSVWDTAAKEKKIVRHFRRKIKMVWRKIQCENNYLMIQGFFSCWELNGSDEKYYLQFHISNTNWLRVKNQYLTDNMWFFPF